MNYVGVDLHKNYSVLCAVDEDGGGLREARIEGNAACPIELLRQNKFASFP